MSSRTSSDDHAPLIGLTGRGVAGAECPGMPAPFAALHVDMYIGAYAAAVTAAGGVPVYLPIEGDPARMIGRLDGVLFTGGADIDPARYGAAVEAKLYGPEHDRDAFELALADAALAAGVPVLGICRGLQLLNVHGGGTLHQHVDGQSRLDVPADEELHDVTFVPGSRLHGLYGAGRTINSLHHQAVRDVAPGWEIVGRDATGGVEAIERPGSDALAVQWHPELLAGAATDPLFAWLVGRAAD